MIIQATLLLVSVDSFKVPRMVELDSLVLSKVPTAQPLAILTPVLNRFNVTLVSKNTLKTVTLYNAHQRRDCPQALLSRSKVTAIPIIDDDVCYTGNTTDDYDTVTWARGCGDSSLVVDGQCDTIGSTWLELNC